MLLVYVFPNQWLGGIQIHRYTSFYASMAEGFMHQTLNLAIRVRVPMEAPQKVLKIVCKAVIKERLRTKPCIFNIAEAVWWSHTRLITLVVGFNSHFRNQLYSIRSECREVLISKLVGMTNIRKIRHVGGTELWEVANSP